MLEDTDKALLDLEGQRFRQTGRKEAAIRERLDMSAIRYYQRLNQLIDDPEALAYAPMTVNRIRRLREHRSRRS
ncbi:MAG: DUF3263 domain-containing protein [Jatrophihabitans sp.]